MESEDGADEQRRKLDTNSWAIDVSGLVLFLAVRAFDAFHASTTRLPSLLSLCGACGYIGLIIQWHY